MVPFCILIHTKQYNRYLLLAPQVITVSFLALKRKGLGAPANLYPDIESLFLKL